MKHLTIILFFFIKFSIYGQCMCNKYEKGIEYIKKDFTNRGIQQYYKSLLNPNAYGISIYESTFPIYKSENYFNWLNIEKTTPLKKSDCLSLLNKKYWSKYWKSKDYYKNRNVFTKEKFKGPSHIAFLNEIKNDSLRVDIISNSYEGMRYCGSVEKYLLIFDSDNNIKDAKSWTSHFECL